MIWQDFITLFLINLCLRFAIKDNTTYVALSFLSGFLAGVLRGVYPAKREKK